MHDLVRQGQREVVLLLLRKGRSGRTRLDQELHETRLGDEDGRLITEFPSSHEHIRRQRSIRRIHEKCHLEATGSVFPHHPPKVIAEVVGEVRVLRPLRVAQLQQLIGGALKILVSKGDARECWRRTLDQGAGDIYAVPGSR